MSFLPGALEGSRSQGGAGRGPRSSGSRLPAVPGEPPASSCLPRPAWRREAQKAPRRPSSKTPCPAPPARTIAPPLPSSEPSLPGTQGVRGPSRGTPVLSPALRTGRDPPPGGPRQAGRLKPGAVRGIPGVPTLAGSALASRPSSASLGDLGAGVSVGITPSAPAVQARAGGLGLFFSLSRAECLGVTSRNVLMSGVPVSNGQSPTAWVSDPVGPRC